jgi:uncharacterized cupin superfamily protein
MDEGVRVLVTDDPGDWEPDEETGGLVRILRADERVEAGLWRPGPAVGRAIEVDLSADEALVVLAGSGRLEVDGASPIDLRPGVMVSIPKGARTRWTVDADFQEFWVYARR